MFSLRCGVFRGHSLALISLFRTPESRRELFNALKWIITTIDLTKARDLCTGMVWLVCFYFGELSGKLSSTV